MVVLALGLAGCGGALAEQQEMEENQNSAATQSVGGTVPTSAASAPTTAANAAPVDTSDAVVISPDSAGQTVNVKVGQNILVKLGEDYKWAVNVTPVFVIGKVDNATLEAGEQGLYTAKMNGRATFQLTGSPACAKDNPPCSDANKQFNVTVVISK
jgi:hypothetical protein